MEALKEKPGPQREQVRMDSWNDDRLDELSNRVDDGFKEMREGFTRVDQEMKAGFSEVRGEMRSVGERVDRLGERLDRLGERVERLAHALMVGGISFGLTALVTIAGLVVTQV